MRCTSTKIGTFDFRVYDQSGVIEYDWPRYPLYIKAGDTARIQLFDNSGDLTKAGKIVITVNEED
ncbi:MAG TPA: hypothetical protein VIM11_16305 [Tepidisphaeraceae bacterium]